MNKYIYNGVIYIESEKEQKYTSDIAAIMAAQYTEMYLAMEGYLVSSTYNLKDKKIEVTVHFNGKPFPKIHQGAKPTKKTITSHQYWHEYTKSMERVRCMDLEFEF